jgi:hypothetical protein
MRTTDLKLPARAAVEVATRHGIIPDRCDILQDANTLVVRLTETLVARVVQDREGPRAGTEWFTRENAIAEHLTRHKAPVIPLHPRLPPGPHEHLGYPMNFWEFVTRVETAPDPTEIGRTLRQCHETLARFSQPLPALGILHETTRILDERPLFPPATQQMLRDRITASVEFLGALPPQPLHGDAHMGNLMQTTQGLLWTDWEDTFRGPIEWDLASLIWNARILDEDHSMADAILSAYGSFDRLGLEQAMIARGAVITAWYPILYPDPDADRRSKLERRLEWLWRTS